MNAERSFSYPFEDKDWGSKLGLGALVSMIPILNFAWSGYLVDIIRNVLNDNPEPLPTWDDLGKKFEEGLILFAAGLVYASPILIAICLPLGMAAASGLFSGDGNSQDLDRWITGTGWMLFVSLACVVLLYGLVMSIVYPAILVLFARDGTFASCFKLREAFVMISRNTVPFLTAWALSFAAGVGVGLISGFVNMVVGWVPCIGWIIGMMLSFASLVYSNAVYAHLFGQFARIVFGRNALAPVTSTEDLSAGSGQTPV